MKMAVIIGSMGKWLLLDMTNRKILLIEDDQVVAVSLMDGLQRGYHVEWQSTGIFSM